MNDARWTAVAELGTPCFVYDVGATVRRVATLRDACGPGVLIRYACKANALPSLVAALRPHLDGADVTSLGELRAALDAGFVGRGLGLTGPGKEPVAVRAIIEAGGEVVVESVEEIAEVAALAAELERPARALLRLNPSERIHAFRLATGGPGSPFGIAEADLDEAVDALLLAAPWVRGEGIHVHRGSQNTSAAGFLRHASDVVRLARRAAARGLPVATINLGGGLGVLPGDGTRLDHEALGKGLRRLHREVEEALPGVRFVLEPGRWLVAEEGTLLLRVQRVLRRDERVFVVVDGGFDCFLFATEGHRFGPPHPVRNLSRSDAPPQRVTLVGPACTPVDTLAAEIAIPEPRRGDLLALGHAGAYAAGASPRGFLGRRPAREVVLDSYEVTPPRVL